MKFIATRFATPHPVLSLREVGGNIDWRVRAECVEIERPSTSTVADDSKLRDRTRCQCTRCGQRADRRGGRNVRHKFVCAACSA